MSKQNNNSNLYNSNNSSNQNKDKPFSLFGFLYSKSKSLDPKNSEEEFESNNENQYDTKTSNNSVKNCCDIKTNNFEFLKMSNTLNELLSISNPINKKISFIKEFNENISKNHVCYKDFELIVYKTIDIFNLKISEEDTECLEKIKSKSNDNITEINQLKILVLKMYTKLINQHFDSMKESLRKIFFVILRNCIPLKNLPLDDKSNTKVKNEFNEVSLNFLNSLTKSGKLINCFRFEIDKFMLNWLNDFFDDFSSNLISTYLTLLTNLIRYNASAFLNESICQIVLKINKFFLINHVNSDESIENELCLDLFDIIFRYSILPSEVLKPFIETLCISVNYDKLRDLSWKILRNLINTDLCYTVLNFLITFLNNENNNETNNDNNDNHILVVCGSVYFVTNSLWNDETKIDKFKYQPSYVLPTLSSALKNENLRVSIYVAIGIKYLLNTQINKIQLSENETITNEKNPTNNHLIGKRKELILSLEKDSTISLPLIYWDNVWDILSQLTDYCSNLLNESDNIKKDLSSNISTDSEDSLNTKFDFKKLFNELDIIASYTEYLFINNKQFSYDEKTFNFICVYSTLQMKICGFENQYPSFLSKRVDLIIDNYETIINFNYENWLQALTKMMDQCFKNNIETNSRIKVLKVLQKRIKLNVEKDEELIVDKIVMPYLKDVDQETDFKVREQILRFLISFLKDVTSNLLFFKVLEILNRVLKKTLIRSRNNSDTSNDVTLEEDPNVLIVNGLMEIFEEKIFIKNCLFSDQIYKLLSNYVCSHYCEGNNFEKISFSMRLKILNFMFKIKTNHDGYIGFMKNDKNSIKFSKYLKCKEQDQLPSSPTKNQSQTSQNQFTTANITPSSYQFSFKEMFTYINFCLSKERDWNLLVIVLEFLPKILSNPFIVYSTNYDQVIKSICENCLNLYTEFTNLNQTNNFINLPKNIKSADLQNYIFPVLTSLITYRDCIEPETQTKIVTGIRKGLCSKQCMQQCIICLTICATELQDAVSKDLPRILSTLSKTTASSQLAIPKLEFLSILNLWPNLYSSFVNEEFLLIFAIILPYTNPMKFDEFSVALAYRVASMWYLSCRYQFRKSIADYIIKQLSENIKFNNKLPKEISYPEEYRKRSSSLNTENDLVKKNPDGSSSIIKLSDINNTNTTTAANNSNNNLHNSPSSPSPGIVHQNSAVFNYNTNIIEKSNVPNSPSTKQQPSKLNLTSQQVELLHSEYVDSFIDLMSRNVVSGCSTLPNQDPISKFLLENGISQTWLYGNKLITITTSSCSSKAMKGGDLCENCYNKLNAFDLKTANKNSIEDDVFNENLNNKVSENKVSENKVLENKLFLEVTTNLNKEFNNLRRRHQSAYTASTASTNINRKLISRDDLQIDNSINFFNTCSSWAAGWAEILIRTPTGNTSWVIKLQNSLISNFQSSQMIDLLPNHSISGKYVNLISPIENRFDCSNQSSNSNNQSFIQTKLNQISEQNYSSNSNQTHQSTLRGRSNTISTSSDMSIKRNELRLSSSLCRLNESDLSFKNKMLPSFVFLQFFHQGTFGSSQETPFLLPKASAFENTLRVFDHITPSETYKVGIIYVDKKQNNDFYSILRNEYGSERYMNFIKRIGTIVRLDETDSQKVFIGGLAQDGQDGDFACIHHENLTQVVFHVTTFMPNKLNDPNCNDKKRHIGNNHVCIVYNDSQEEFDFSLIKGQWLKVCTIITPTNHGMNFIHVQTIPELENFILHKNPVIVSDFNMPQFVRQLSINASLISLVHHNKFSNYSSSPFLSNWVDRIRKMKDIKEKVRNFNSMNSFLKQKPNSSSINKEIKTATNSVANNFELTNSFPENFTNFI